MCYKINCEMLCDKIQMVCDKLVCAKVKWHVTCAIGEWFVIN